MTVEIVGHACEVPGAGSPEQLFDLLREQRCTVTEIPDDRWDKARYWHPKVGIPGKTYTFAAGVIPSIMDFDPTVFGLSPRETESLDPQQRLLLRLAWRALEDANLSAGTLQGERVGVYVGASSLEHGNLIVGDPAAASPYFMTGNTLSIIANRISHIMGFHGPSLTVDTACSSGLVALDLAVRALESGDVDTALVGSVNILAHPLSFVGFAQARMLAPYGLCRSYDNLAEGYVRAEGGALLILRRTDSAERAGDRSHARILATGVNSAGRTNGISLPSREAQAALLRSIYQGRGIDVDRLAFVEGHGTGTRVGDPAELWALGTEIGMRRKAALSIGSIKSNIGHTEPASGLLGVMKAVLALKNNLVPASLHFETPNEQVDFAGLNVRVASTPIELMPGRKPRLAGINSFGFGGTNVHVVVSDPDMAAQSKSANVATEGRGFLLVSAQSASSLRELLASYRESFVRTEPLALPALIAAIGANRHHMRHRFAIPASDPNVLIGEIDDFLDGRIEFAAAVGEAPKDQAKTAFVFSGNGSQWAGMSVEAYERNVAFRERFRTIDALFQSACDIKLTELLVDPELDAKLGDTRIAQPLLFATQAALAETLIELGLTPSAVYGHSIGEVAAAYVAGAISLVDAVTIVVKRSRHQHEVAGHGQMAAVAMGSDEAIALARSEGLNAIEAAAINSHISTTVSGPTAEIEAFSKAAISRRVAAQILDIDYPFHHPIIDRVRSNFLEDLTSLSLRASRIPFISTVSGRVLGGEELTPAYWWDNIREPVQFAAATATAIREGCRVFIEIGPRPIFISHLRDINQLHDVGGTVAPTLVRSEVSSKRDPVHMSFAKAITIGAEFDAAKAIGSRDARITLPTLPFETRNFHYKRTPEALDIYGDGSRDLHTLAGWRIDSTGHAWHNHIDAQLYADLADHVVEGRPILPAAAFIDIMLAVARRYHSGTSFEISNLEILHPMELSQSKLLEVSTSVSPETGRIEIRSRERLKDEDWVVHAVARTRSSVIPITWDDTPLQVQGEAVAADEVYRTANRFGLNYGPAFRLLRRVIRRGERYIEVELAPASKPTHPFVHHELNPMSMDAALHGLVGLFREFAAGSDTTPYIPVRFGFVQLHQPGVAVSRAAIFVEKISPYSIKANIRLLDARGEPVATLLDCRMRRSRLKPRKSLEAQSYHYEAIVSSLAAIAANPGQETALPSFRPAIPLFSNDVQPARSDASLVLDAALYRACYDVARRHLAMPTRSSAYSSFVNTCLHRLEESGLAEMTDSGWRVAESCPLPGFEELLSQFLKEDGGRSVEAILLNDAYRNAMDVKDTAQVSLVTDSNRKYMSDATMEHASGHSSVARLRREMIADALRKNLAGLGQTKRFIHVVELCASSRTQSQMLAEIVGEARARFTIVEPNARLRNDLMLAFRNLVHVEVVAEVDQNLEADIIVSTSAELHGRLEQNGPDGLFVKAVLSGGGALIGCFDPPGLFNDFVFGQHENWFARAIDSEFPIGHLASPEEWRGLADRLGAVEVGQKLVDTPTGYILSLAWSGQPIEITPPVAAFAPAMVCCDGEQSHHLRHIEGLITLSGDEKADLPEMVAALRMLPTDHVVVFVAGSFGQPSGADALQTNVAELSCLLREMVGGALPDKPTRLAVILPGGSPVMQAGKMEISMIARNAALWSFLRVVRNEYPDIDIHSVDLSGSERPLAEQISITRQLCEAPTANREWIWDEAAGGLCELRAVAGPFVHEARATRDYEVATLRHSAVSSIAALEWETSELRALRPDEVYIEVAATALNYRDVMWAIGMLPEEALEDGFAGPSIGMECSGRIVAIGEEVENLAIGDRVMACASSAFSTHVVAETQGVVRLPDRIPLVAGATLPVVFLTAYYAIVELAGLRRGETVLIHGGAGGVGLAALQIAKVCGATVIATASTEEKRVLLSTLGADHVFDSRSLNFVGQIRDIAGDRGVDVVLNSLFGGAMERSISVLKPFGRFLELGKRDYFSDTKIGLRPFRRNISYFGIDVDQLLKSRPELTARMFSELAELFDGGKLHPIPFREFSYDEIRDAFRLMQGSGHIGKIVVTPPVPGRDDVSRAVPGFTAAPTDGIYLVVGGTGGFALEAAHWLVERGVRQIALASRRGANEETAAAIAEWVRLGVDVSTHACDVTDEAALGALLDALRARAPLRGVLHAAMVLDDAMLVNLNRERNRPVIEVKAKGAELLDRLTQDDELTEFLLFSSITTLIGNPGQANYVAGNGFLEGVARARRMRGQPAIAAGFGAITDKGYLANNKMAHGLLAKHLGKFALTAREALDKLGEYIAADPGTVDAACVTIGDVNIGTAKALKIVSSPLFDTLMRLSGEGGASLTDDEVDLVGLIQGKSPKEGEQVVFDLVASEIAATLRVPVAEISRTRIIREIGIDSLMAMELGMNFQQKTNFDLPLTNLTETTTVGEISHKLYLRVSGTTEGEDQSQDVAIVEQLVERHVAGPRPKAVNQ